MRLSIGDRSVVCVDWDERSLRALDARFTRGGVQIRTAVHVPLEPGTDPRDPASMGDFLRRTLAEHRIRHRRAIVDVPRQDAVLNPMSLPDGSLDELTAMVHIQIAKELPFSMEQAVVDFAVSRTEGSGTCDVWVAAVRNHVIDYYQQVIRAAGLKLERIGLRPYANLAALRGDETASGRTLLVDVGPAMTEIDVIRDGRLVFSRAASVSVPRHGLFAAPAPAAREPAEDAQPESGTAATIPLADDFAPRPAPVDALLIEISRTVEAYRAIDLGATIDRVIVSGTAGVDEQARRAIEKRFGKPTRIFEVPPASRWPSSDRVPAAPLIAVIGLALSSAASDAEHFDLLHPKEPEAGRRQRARRVPVAGATAALFVAAASVAAYQSLRPKYAEIDRLSAEITRLNKDEKQRKAFMRQYDDVMNWRRQSVVWIDALRHMAGAFPSNQEAYITDLDCDEKGRIELELAAKDRMVATRFISEVEKIRTAGELLGHIDGAFAEMLDEGTLSPGLREALADRRVRLGPDVEVVIEEKSARWLLGDRDHWYVIQKGREDLRVHRAVRVFEAEPGTPKSYPRDPEYPYRDMVTIQVKALRKD